MRIRECIVQILLVAITINFFSMSRAYGTTAVLSWDASSDNDTRGYRIYYGFSTRISSCPPGGYIDSVDVGNTNYFIFPNLYTNVTYYFSITSYNSAYKEGSFFKDVIKVKKSSIKRQLVGNETLKKPDNLEISFLATHGLRLTWDALNENSGIAGYKVFRESTAIATVITNSFDDVYLNPETSYTVTSFNLHGNESLKSASVNIKHQKNKAASIDTKNDGALTVGRDKLLVFVNIVIPAKLTIYSLADGVPVFTEDISSNTYTLQSNDFASGKYFYLIVDSSSVYSGNIEIMK